MVLRNIVLLRMETINQLDQCRFIMVKSKVYLEKKINVLLDRLNYLNKLEQELTNKI